MKIFNEFGVPTKEVLDAQLAIHNLTKTFIDDLIIKGVALGDIRGVTLMLMGGIEGAASDSILRAQMEYRRTPEYTAAALEEIKPQLLDLLSKGDKIPAIRIVREHTGMGLREAKEYVEAL